jgi:hypothetical protein
MITINLSDEEEEIETKNVEVKLSRKITFKTWHLCKCSPISMRNYDTSNRRKWEDSLSSYLQSILNFTENDVQTINCNILKKENFNALYFVIQKEEAETQGWSSLTISRKIEKILNYIHFNFLKYQKSCAKLYYTVQI